MLQLKFSGRLFIIKLLLTFAYCLQSFWVTDEEFGMGYLELKPAPSLASKSLSGNVVAVQGSAINVSQSEPGTGKAASAVVQHSDSGNLVKDYISRTKPADGRLERTESISHVKSDNIKLKGSLLTNGSDIHSSMPSTAVQAEMSRVVENQKLVDEDEIMAKVATKNSAESEVLSESHCCMCNKFSMI